MKFFSVVLFVSLAFCLPSATSIFEALSNNTANMNEIFSAQGKTGDIEYRITGRLQKKGVSEGVDYPNDNIVVEYELKNTGKKSYVVYDRGHSSDSGGDFVAVEPAGGGAVELSLKAFSEPAGKNCPARFVAVVPLGTLLKAGEIIKQKTYVELPLKAKTPFDDCEPQTPLAPNASRVKFCIGFQAAEEKTKVAENGRISPLPDFQNQQLICTGLGEIKSAANNTNRTNKN